MDNKRTDYGFPSEESELLQELMMQELSAMSSETLAAADVPVSPSGERDPLPASFSDLLEQTILDPADDAGEEPTDEEDDELFPDEEDDELFGEADEEYEDEFPALIPAAAKPVGGASALTAAPKKSLQPSDESEIIDDEPKPDEKSDAYYTRIGCIFMAVAAVVIVALVWWLIASGILAAILKFLLKAAILIGLIWWVIAKVFDL